MVVSIYQAAQRERAAAAALSRAGKDLVKAVTTETKTHVVGWARDEAMRYASTPVERKLAASAAWSPYKGTPGVRFGGMRAVTSTGTPGRLLVRALEYGSDGRRWRDYLENRDGRQVSVLRRTTRQFMPDTGYAGRVFTPAMDSITDDVLHLWVRITEDTYSDAFGGL